MQRSIAFFLFSFLWLACTSTPPVPVAAHVSELVVANGRIHLADAGDDPSAFFAIQNQGAHPRTIVGGRCAMCEGVEIHRAMLSDGAMISQVLAEWEIPAGGAVAFAPRGLSLSLVGSESLEAGDLVQIELDFADGEKVTFDAVVREP